MKAHLQLSREDVHALDAILAPLSERAKDRLSLNQLLHGWGYFVVQVERQYEGSIYEYTNDLSTRDLLEEILLRVPQPLHDRLSEAVSPWDDRFHEATRKVKRPLAPGVAQDAPSWWFRVPKNLSKQLENDLRAEGILEW